MTGEKSLGVERTNRGRKAAIVSKHVERQRRHATASLPKSSAPAIFKIRKRPHRGRGRDRDVTSRVSRDEIAPLAIGDFFSNFWRPRNRRPARQKTKRRENRGDRTLALAGDAMREARIMASRVVCVYLRGGVSPDR